MAAMIEQGEQGEQDTEDGEKEPHDGPPEQRRETTIELLLEPVQFLELTQ